MFTWGIEVNSEQFYLSHLECDFEEARRGQNPKMKILESQRGACHQTNIQHALSSKPSPFLLTSAPDCLNINKNMLYMYLNTCVIIVIVITPPLINIIFWISWSSFRTWLLWNCWTQTTRYSLSQGRGVMSGGACPDRTKPIRALPLSEYLTITHRNLVKPSSKAGPLNNNIFTCCVMN